MILMFTSDHCVWCEVVRKMLKREDTYVPGVSIYEINIDRYRRLARAFGILVVPTLVAGGRTLAGLPTHSDLQNFILQASSEESNGFGSSYMNQFTRGNEEDTSEKGAAAEDHLLA